MSQEPLITMVFPANIAKLWPQVAPLLQPAIDLSGTHDAEDVRKKLIAGNAQLWVQWSEKVDAAAVTEFIDYPRGLWLRVWLAGAAIKGAWAEFQRIIIEFASANQCVGVENWGRKGWERLHSNLSQCGTVAMIYRYHLAPGESL